MKAAFFAAIAAVCCSLSAQAGTSSTQSDVFGQPSTERAAQSKLPQSHDAIWATLNRTVSEDAKLGIYTARHPPEVQAMAGKQVTIQGFMLPYTTDTQVRHFLLTRYTPVCFFCPPGAPNEVVDVTVDRPVKWEDKLYSVSGIFAIQNDGEKGLFFRLDNARIVEPVKLDGRGLPQSGTSGTGR